jgi:hypothetical protein
MTRRWRNCVRVRPDSAVVENWVVKILLQKGLAKEAVAADLRCAAIATS